MEPEEHPSEPGEQTRIELIYAHFRADRPAAEIEELLEEHPRQRAELLELLELHEFFVRVEGALGQRQVENQTSLDRAAQRFRSVDPRLGELMDEIRGRRTRFERYRVEEQVGQGGVGTVLRVWDRELERPLAMKVLRVSEDTPLNDPAETRKSGRFLEEVQVTAQLDHPGIVPVHELGMDDAGRLYFTMRLVRGRTLGAVFLEVHDAHNAEWTLTRALNLVLKACEAVSFAHSKGVIHRDLKPANIMVGRFGEVCVMDWGLARALDRPDSKDLRIRAPEDVATVEITSLRRKIAEQDSPLLTMDGDVMGTPAYMSPEQAGGRIGEMGPRSDVYSLGAILYHLLVGHAPYSPSNRRRANMAVWASVRKGAPAGVSTLAPDAPQELVAICEKAMARDPLRRYADVLALTEDLRAYLEGRVVSAHRTDTWTSARKWVARNWVLARGLATAAALLAVVTLVFALRLRSEVVAKTEAHSELTRTTLERDAVMILPAAADLVERAETLYPVHPDSVEGMQRWEAEARTVSRTCDELLEVEVGEQALPADRVAAIEAAHSRLRAASGRVARRREAALDLERETLMRYSDHWQRALAEIAAEDGPYASPPQGPLKLAPQLGLIPLRSDPRTGCWEFCLASSGEVPELDPETDEWRIAADTGVVLVLLPGASSFEFTPAAGGSESVSVAALFIGKYEVTQGQWSRIMGDNPSTMLAGTTRKASTFDGSHPVDSVTWHEAQEFCRRLGLALPSDIAWQYASRAGTRTRYWFGDEPGAVARHENTASGLPPGADSSAGDRFPYTAPVGSISPNPFGLYDSLGNVAEFTSELSNDGRSVIVRGGHFLQPGLESHAVAGGTAQANTRSSGTGLRVMRAGETTQPKK